MSMTPHTRRLEFLGRADCGQVCVAEAGEAMVHRHDDDVSEQGELTAVAIGALADPVAHPPP